MRGAIITITMRNNQAENIRLNWLCQKLQLPLIVVTNGLADPNNFSFASLVIKGPIKLDKSTCINLAVKAAKEEYFADYVIQFDDDDYYGKNYITEHYNAFSNGAIVTGKRDRYIKTSKNRLWKLINCHDRFPLGCTLGFKTDLPNWTGKPGIWGEEMIFGDQLAKMNITPTWLSTGNFAQCRYNNGSTHAMQVQDTYFINNCDKILDLGKWDEEIVNLYKSEPIGKILKVSDEDRLPYGYEIPLHPCQRQNKNLNHYN